MTIFDLFYLLDAVDEEYPPELLADRRAEFERQIDEAETEEIGHMTEWLGDSDTVSEPATAGACTSLAYGDADLAEMQARHIDWLDEQRTQREAIY